MKLIVTRGQGQHASGMINKTSELYFSLSVMLRMSDEERRVIEKYNVANKVWFAREITRKFGGKAETVPVHTDSLAAGITYESADLSDLLDFEAEVRKVCRATLDNALAMEAYGGSEEVEF